VGTAASCPRRRLRHRRARTWLKCSSRRRAHLDHPVPARLVDQRAAAGAHRATAAPCRDRLRALVRTVDDHLRPAPLAMRLPDRRTELHLSAPQDARDEYGERKSVSHRQPWSHRRPRWSLTQTGQSWSRNRSGARETPRPTGRIRNRCWHRPGLAPLSLVVSRE